MAGLVAVTGANGFIGRHVAARLRASGIAARVLLRRPVPEIEHPGIEVVRGDILDRAALERLLDGADAVVHVAGLVRAVHASDFRRVNEGGTALLAEVASGLPRPPHVVLVSSLAAREPRLSPYAQSKRLAEQALANEGGRLSYVTVRPPAVYGPGDRATAGLISQLARGWLVAPASAGARFSLVYVEDLVNLLVGLASERTAGGLVIEPDDGRLGGYDWKDLATIAASVTGKRVRMVRVSRALLGPAAAGAEAVARLSGRPGILTRGKLAELFHDDWVVNPQSYESLDWRPATTFAAGFAATLSWLRSTPIGKTSARAVPSHRSGSS